MDADAWRIHFGSEQAGFSGTGGGLAEALLSRARRRRAARRRAPHAAATAPVQTLRSKLPCHRFNTPIPLPSLVERLHLHEPVIVVATDQARHRRRRIIYEHR